MDSPQDTNPTISSLRGALDAVGDRWSLLVVAALLDGPRRFGDLQTEVDGIASNILSSRLKALVEGGLLTAEPYSDRPPRLAYEVTDAGRALAEPLRMLAGWGARHRDLAAPPVHDVCGTALEVSWCCPACREPVADASDEELQYA
jgi:DNA-binding HxlR family transcriptional regulator